MPTSQIKEIITQNLRYRGYMDKFFIYITVAISSFVIKDAPV